MPQFLVAIHHPDDFDPDTAVVACRAPVEVRQFH